MLSPRANLVSLPGTGIAVPDLPCDELQVTTTCLVRHLPLKYHSIDGGTRFHIRKLLMTWSPLTESNRRPSPYHAHFPGFTARQALPAGRRQALIWVLPRPAASATAQAIAPTAGAAAGTGLCPAGSSHPRLCCHSGPARGAACRPATSTPTVKRRSDDLSHPARPGPEDHAEQAVPHLQEKFEPVPLSVPRMTPPAAAQKSCRAQDHTAAHAGHRARRPARQSAASSTGTPGSAELRALSAAN